MSAARTFAGVAVDRVESAAPLGSSERDWWLRALLVLQAPVPVFAALRDDSEEGRQARQEPVTALVFLAGIAAVLASPGTGTLMDRGEIDGVVAAVLVFLAGGIYGAFGYWAGGGALALGTRGAGVEGGYRRARHVLAFASAPLALSLLVLWPVQLALFGGDVFRGGGEDAGTVGRICDGLEWAFVVWSVALLAVGLRLVYRLDWRRALAALGVAVLALLALVLAFGLFA